MLGCTPLLAVNTEDMRFQHYCRLLSIISHSATTANRSSRSRNCVHGRSRSNTVHRMLYLVHQPHTHACDRSWLIMAFNRAWWRQWEHYFAVCGISYTSCQHIFFPAKICEGTLYRESYSETPAVKGSIMSSSTDLHVTICTYVCSDVTHRCVTATQDIGGWWGHVMPECTQHH